MRKIAILSLIIVLLLLVLSETAEGFNNYAGVKGDFLCLTLGDSSAVMTDKLNYLQSIQAIFNLSVDYNGSRASFETDYLGESVLVSLVARNNRLIIINAAMAASQSQRLREPSQKFRTALTTAYGPPYMQNPFPDPKLAYWMVNHTKAVTLELNYLSKYDLYRLVLTMMLV